METDQIERLLAHDPLMCHYTVTAKDELPEIVKTYPFALGCNTHNADQPGEHWVEPRVVDDKIVANSTHNGATRERW